jgi:two-component system cell cycle response regulator
MTDGRFEVLLIEDNPVDARFVEELLGPDGGFGITRAESLAEGIDKLGERHFDAVLLDLMLPDSQGLGTLCSVQDRVPEVPIIVYSGFGADDILFAREAIRIGAQDFLPKSEAKRTDLQRAILASIERKRLERHRVRFARHDELTGLPNRLLLAERFERAAVRADRQGRLMAVMAIGLDYYLGVVEQLGSEVGDRLFAAVAGRLETKLRKCDTLARTRERGFVGLLEGLAAPQQAEALARRVAEIMAPPFQLEGQELQLGASVGIALHPIHGRDLDELIDVAEDTMFEVATDGGNAFRMAPVSTAAGCADAA